MFRSLFAVACLAALIACGPDGAEDPGPAWLDGLEVTEVGDVEEVRVLPWRVPEEPSVRIGGSGPGPDAQFVEITAAIVLRDGKVLIADGRGGLVHLYGPDGAFLRRLGSQGEGPGEFRSPSSVLQTPGDSLWIWDRTLWRVSVFGPQGDFVRAERYDPTAAGLFPVQGMWPATVRLAGKGTRLLHLLRKGEGKKINGSEAARVGLAIHRYGAAEVELVAILPGEERVEVEAPWGPAALTPPLAAGPEIALDSDEHWACVGHQAVPELLCVEETGRRIGLRWRSRPRPVRPDDPAVARWRDETREAYSSKLSERDVEAMISAVPLPRSYPAFRKLLFDALGCLWVGLGPSPQLPSQAEYLVFGPDLRLKGRIMIPGMHLIEIGPDRILGVRQDAFGVEEVLVFPLSRGSAGEVG